MINEFLILLEKQKDELYSILRRVVEVNMVVNGGKPEVPDSFAPATEPNVSCTAPQSVISRLEAVQAAQHILLRDIRNELSFLETSLGLVENEPKKAQLGHGLDGARPIR